MAYSIRKDNGPLCNHIKLSMEQCDVTGDSTRQTDVAIRDSPNGRRGVPSARFQPLQPSKRQTPTPLHLGIPRIFPRLGPSENSAACAAPSHESRRLSTSNIRIRATSSVASFRSRPFLLTLNRLRLRPRAA
ncbi:hypothetical protein CLAIMM_04583 [Cladophialophora immunda]|nr:hypothetical protein CLAIMM_04583 [Cladophialophora immunda]